MTHAILDTENNLSTVLVEGDPIGEIRKIRKGEFVWASHRAIEPCKHGKAWLFFWFFSETPLGFYHAKESCFDRVNLQALRASVDSSEATITCSLCKVPKPVLEPCS
jgi:hypothetical protein